MAKGKKIGTRLKSALKSTDEYRFQVTPAGEWITNGHFMLHRRALQAQGLGLPERPAAKPDEPDATRGDGDRVFYRALLDMSPREIPLTTVEKILPRSNGQIGTPPAKSILHKLEATNILDDTHADSGSLRRLYLGPWPDKDTGFQTRLQVWLDVKYLELMSADGQPELFGADENYPIIGYGAVDPSDSKSERFFSDPDFVIMPVRVDNRITITRKDAA